MNQLQQLRQLWQRLTLRQRASIAVAALAVAAGLTFGVRYQKEQDFKPLFTKLSDEDAKQVTARLTESGVEYRLARDASEARNRQNIVSVPSAKVPDMRIQLAGEGLAKTGRLGFEIFDKENLTATAFQEQVNFHRAVEGELERSYMALGEVEEARVHVTFAKESVFADQRRPAKASVMLRLKEGATLDGRNVAAIANLAASAVENLIPEDVTVIDMRGKRMSRPKRPEDEAAEGKDEEHLKYRRALEEDLQARLDAVLTPALGRHHYSAGVAVEVDFSTSEQSEESFDPNRSVMTSEQRSEDTSANAQQAGIPGTPSTLPRPASKPAENGKTVQRRTENITYQSTRSIRKTTIPEGTIRRITASVILDQQLRWEGAGPKAKRILEPASPEEIKKVTDLVSGVLGIQSQRGDVVNVESLPFEATLRMPPPPLPPPPPSATGTTAPPAAGGQQFVIPALPPIPAWVPAPIRDYRILGAIAAGIVLLLVVLVILLRRLKIKLPIPSFRKGKGAKGAKGKDAKDAKASATAAKQLDGTKGIEGGPAAPGDAHASGEAAALPPGEPGLNPPLPHSAEEAAEAMRTEQEQRRRKLEIEALMALKQPEVEVKKGEVLAKFVMEEARRDPVGVATVLRNWLEEDGFAR
jgi:flagellar M-ring protein FliF